MPVITDFEEYRQLREELFQSSQWQLKSDINNLGISKFIFDQNYYDLKRLALAFAEPKFAIEVSRVGNEEKMKIVHRTFVRLLHNYLASAHSLIEHSQVFKNKYYNDHDFKQEYQDKITSHFDNSQLAHFIKELRHYIIHKGLPITSARIQFGRDKEFDSSIMLHINEMREWSGWTSKSTEFMKALNDKIKIYDIVDSYWNLVGEFYDWFGQKQDEIHAEEFSFIRNTIDELIRFENNGMKRPIQ